MADQATKSIRRIVRGLKDEPAGLDNADDYTGLGTSRGEAFINARGDVTGSGSTGSGDDKDEQPPSNTPDTGSPDDNDTGGSGGVNDGSGAVGALNGDVKDVDDATNTDSQIGTLTGTDPSTGNITSLNINTLEGIEYIPPDGWPSPDEGPPVESTDTTPSCANIGCPTPVGNGSFIRKWYSGNGKVYEILYDRGPSGSVDHSPLYPGGAINNCTSCPLHGTTSGVFFPALFRSTEVFLTPPPNEIGQPSDGNCQVVYDSESGGYKGHVDDLDCSAAQILPTDFVIIKSVSDPTKFFRYTKLANGGTKITQVDAGGVPVPGTITKTTDEGGRVDGFFDVSLDAGIT